MKLSDIYNSICIDSSVENKNCILLKLYFTTLSVRCSSSVSFKPKMRHEYVNLPSIDCGSKSNLCFTEIFVFLKENQKSVFSTTAPF